MHNNQLDFLNLENYIYKTTDIIMKNNIPNYTRQMPLQTRQKIAQTMRSKGIRHTPDWNNKISQSLRQTWSRVPETLHTDTEDGQEDDSSW